MFGGFRKFLNKTGRLFGKNARRSEEIAAEWSKTLKELSTVSNDLSQNFGKLPITVVGSRPRVGRIDGWQFAKGMRRGKSITAFESASDIKIPSNARSAFESLDNYAKLNFPDTIHDIKTTYGKVNRDRLIANGKIASTEVVENAEHLERIVRSDPELLSKATRLERYARTTKKLIYLGGVIAFTGIGIAALCQIVAKYAAENTGCFMYTFGDEKTTKCKILGCSCGTQTQYTLSCKDSLLPDDMRIENSACKSGSGTYCVHCNWNETDETSIDYVNRDKLADNSMVVCEKIDGLDALIEMIGGTVDDGWKKGKEIIGGASDSLSDILKFIPIIFFGIIALIGLVFTINIIKVFASSNKTNDYGKSTEGGGIYSRLD